MRKILIVLVMSLFVLSSCSTSNNITGETSNENIFLNPISIEELSVHNTTSDCWVAYNGYVYDITEFISKHKVPLEKYCGTSDEFTTAYTNQHDGSKDDVLEKYKVGYI